MRDDSEKYQKVKHAHTKIQKVPVKKATKVSYKAFYMSLKIIVNKMLKSNEYENDY